MDEILFKVARISLPGRDDDEERNEYDQVSLHEKSKKYCLNLIYPRERIKVRVRFPQILVWSKCLPRQEHGHG